NFLERAIGEQSTLCGRHCPAWISPAIYVSSREATKAPVDVVVALERPPRTKEQFTQSPEIGRSNRIGSNFVSVPSTCCTFCPHYEFLPIHRGLVVSHGLAGVS